MNISKALKSRWRAIPILGFAQILSWGAIYYTPVLIVPLIAEERGWSLTLAMAGFSVALLAAGVTSPFVGRWIDRYGGHVVMPVGFLLGAAALLAITFATHIVAYFAVWILIGLAIPATLYDPAFATLARIFGSSARSAITLLTFIGGFASTVSWPLTHLLIEKIGWQSTYQVYAALLAFTGAPLLAFALPREQAAKLPLPENPVRKAKYLPAKGLPFLLVACGFALYMFIPSALSAHMLAIFQREGIDAATVVTIGALFGPAQVSARLIEFTFGRKQHPLDIARVALCILLIACAGLVWWGFSPVMAAGFTIMFGIANGWMTIARGNVPLALFGPDGYGRMIGQIAAPVLLMQAVGPLLLALVSERLSDGAAIGTVGLFALGALGCLIAIRRP
ncbi:MAG TPA: MFS transporter [Xanthobacteraceae bacterium]|jgi:MFS family permease|nr:MFS transporter [Xanthobacteraceae bacterium]